MIKNSLAGVIAAGWLVAATVAHATPTVYFGENQTPAGQVSGAPLDARTQFLSKVTGVTSQGFESYANLQAAPLNLSFTGSNNTTLAATLSGEGQIIDGTQFADTLGRFNTTPKGSKWWDVSGTFVLSFASPISAFGFYGTDVGDFNGQVTIDLQDTNGAHTLYTVQNTVNGANGSLLFWGFVDNAKSYTKITFGNTNAGTDSFGFDDMVIGDIGQVCTVSCTPNPAPEPGSLALVGLGLLAAGATARRARRA